MPALFSCWTIFSGSGKSRRYTENVAAGQNDNSLKALYISILVSCEIIFENGKHFTKVNAY